MPHIYLPSSGPDQWAPFLAEPVKHWRTGYSARTLAYSWQEADGFPAEVSQAFATSSSLAGTQLLLALPEHRVSLPGGNRASQNDIWALAKANGDLVSIAVEGKVSENFDKTVGEWLSGASSGKLTRLAFLQHELGLNDVPLDAIRYQLLHRTVSAIVEAKRFGAKHAVMLVHSFSPQRQWFEDYAAFAKLFGVSVEPGHVVHARRFGGIELHLGWVCGNPDYLSR